VPELDDDVRAAVAELSAADLPSRLTDGRADPDHVRGLLALLEERFGEGEPAVARAVAAGTAALAAWLPDDLDAGLERQRLRRLQLRGLLACGELDAACDTTWWLQNSLRASGDFDSAWDVLTTTLSALPPGHDRRAWVLLWRAEVARHRQEFALAEDDLLEATEEAQSNPRLAEPYFEGTLKPAIVGLRVQIYLDQGLHELASKTLDEEFAQLSAAREAGVMVPLVWQNAYLHRANLRLAYGHYGILRKEVEQALAELGSTPDLEGQLVVVRRQLELRLAIALIEQGRNEQQLLERARDLLEPIWAGVGSDLQTRFYCASRLGEIALLQGDHDRSLRVLKEARLFLQEGLKIQAGQQFDLKERAYITALETRLALRRDTARETLQSQVDQLRAEFREMLKQWKTKPLREGGWGFLRYDPTRAVLGELLAGTQALADDADRGAEHALELLHAAGSAGTLHRRLEAGLPELAELRSKVLPQGVGALVYLPFADRTLVFTVDATTVALHECESERILSKYALDFMTDLMTPPHELTTEQQIGRDGRLASLGDELAKGLLPPSVVERVQRWSTIYVVGSDLLNELCFEALPFRDEGPLGLVKATAYLPSLPIGARLHDRVPSQSSQDRASLCLVARIQSGSAAHSQEDLPFGDRELQLLTHSFPSDRVKTFLGPQASRKELLRPDALRADILHFVTHGARDEELERPPGLVLSAGEALWCKDADSLGGARLVLISACGAGSGPPREGDGPVSHLGGSFLCAGAECVVLADGQLAYRPTIELMAVLQDELAAGIGTAEALRRARRGVSGSEGYADPFYWALVRALGHATRPLFMGPR
jgi:hypothetical protein